jgi:hypothetical protein
MLQSKDFDAARARSLVVELGAAALLRARGWWVLPAYDYSGTGDSKAPRLCAPSGWDDLVLPDLLAFNGRKTIWAELKLKTRAIEYRKTGQLTTGLCLRLYRHYRQVQEITGAAVWLLFAHEEEQEVRGDKLDELEKVVDHECPPCPGFRHGGLFYRYNDMPRRFDLATLLGAAPQNPADAAQPDPAALAMALHLGLLPTGAP